MRLARSIICSCMALAFLCTGMLGGCQETGKPAEKRDFVENHGPKVTQQQCIGCHKRESEQWKTSHHALAHTTTPGVTPGVTPGIMAIGVEPLVQFLEDQPDGRKQVRPMAWDAVNKLWFNADGKEFSKRDPMHWTRPLHNWNFMCAECHATNLIRGFDSQTLSYNTKAEAYDVGCKSCHFQNLKTSETQNLKVSTAENLKTPNRRAVEMCAACHSRRAVISDGHTADKNFDDDYLVSVLQEDLYFADGQIKEEVYEYGSFVQSRMYEKGIACTDCHNPHTGKLKKEGNALCVSCHTTKQYNSPEHHMHANESVGAQCVNCHAPTRMYMQIDARHDHSFRVPRPDLSIKYNTPNACNKCHTNQSATWAANAITKHKGQQGQKYSDSEKRREQYLDAIYWARKRDSHNNRNSNLISVIQDLYQAPIYRATALLALDPNNNQSIEAALNATADADALVRRCAFEFLSVVAPSKNIDDAFVRALTDISASVRITAFGLGTFDKQNLAFKTAREEYVSVQKLIGGLGNGAVNLGALALQDGDVKEAERQFKQALREDELAMPAMVNLVDVVRLRDEKEAEKLLHGFIKKLPNSAELHYSLGLSLIRQKRYAEAAASINNAKKIDPRNDLYSEMLMLLKQH